jgi:5-oxoprolinase (ATP-hydrolysing)
MMDGFMRKTSSAEGWRFWMDQGGTFTDCIGIAPDGAVRVAKALSGPLAPLSCIRHILGLGEDDPLPPSDIRLGTTLATNALLERNGHPHALLVTEGFADALEIGTQQRPDIFALDIRKPGVLYSEVVEARERLEPDGDVSRPMDMQKLREDLSRLRDRGVTGLAIVLLHGYAFPAHEKAAADCARELGFARVSCSHEVNPEIGLTARGDTTTVDAYLTPLLADYLETLRKRLPGSRLRLMQSNGGLTDPDRFRGHNAILSGPAGGVVAYSRLAERGGYPRAIGFDMGGTSTDVSRHAGGGFGKIYEWKAAGLRIRSPSLDIHTVASGGGSLCRLKSGRLTVGPESAGADPGPVCYGRREGGELTVTDVNLFLGRLLQDNFPFPLRADRVAAKMEELRGRLRGDGQDMPAQAIAGGFLEIVNRQMAQAVKDISLARGHEAADHVLICFGGAGGQHACAVARLLGIRRILLHPLGGVLSALGMGLAASRWEGSAPVARLALGPSSLDALEPAFAALEAEGLADLRAQGYLGDTVSFRRCLDLRYRGTEHALTVSNPGDGDWSGAFRERHGMLYGYTRPGREVEILQMRVEAIGEPETPWPELAQPSGTELPPPLRTTRMWLRSGAAGEAPAGEAPVAVEVPVYRREDIPAGLGLEGPALILDKVATVVLEEDFRATVDTEGQLVLEKKAAEASAPFMEASHSKTASEPVLLELFNHAFMAIAGHMGKILQRTALSTNIKERLDFSCAVFDAAGNLVANAPHIPVHLGAMGESVRHVLKAWPQPMPGDVFVTNNPYRGGSHLPDITVVTPVFPEPDKPADTIGAAASTDGPVAPIFFTASRAHHADVGGITPGSMPAFSSRLEEEGLLFDAEKLIDQGRFRSEAIAALLASGPYPARNPSDNLADLEAQAAANQAGVRMLHDLVAEHGLGKVRDQMGKLRANAARQVRDALSRLPEGLHEFADALDDGTPVRVRVTLSKHEAIVDFSGSGSESAGNLNAPPAVVRSAVMYVLRCLVAERIPMNEGCLDPVRIILPPASLLNPSPGHAVVGGNVETSQRVVDCLLGALGLAAASQGTMNNITFGDGTFGYYETLAGGSGAGPGFHGASAVHTHMTNTRITDPEVLETRYPVRLERFAIRRGSGGPGKWNGGDGLIRHYRFLKPVEVSLLTQRRVPAPFGLQGGEAGARGKNLRITAAGQRTELPGATSFATEAGEGLILETPGGGGWGRYGNK